MQTNKLYNQQVKKLREELAKKSFAGEDFKELAQEINALYRNSHTSNSPYNNRTFKAFKVVCGKTYYLHEILFSERHGYCYIYKLQPGQPESFPSGELADYEFAEIGVY